MSFKFPIRVYWEDTDAGGIVYYANYLKFLERARTEWLRSLGISQHALRAAAGGMFVVREASLRYHRPARLDDELLVTAHVEEMRRASLLLAQEVVLLDDSVLLCEGTIRIGWVDSGSLKPARIPPNLLELFKK